MPAGNVSGTRRHRNRRQGHPSECQTDAVSASYDPSVFARQTGGRAQLIYDAVKERLISGGHPHGSRLSVEALRTEFNVSKQPVMEALRLLSGDGLIEIIPQVGSVVATYPIREVADFFAMFAGFEGAIAAAAAERRSVEQIEALRLVSEEVGHLRSNPDGNARARSYRLLNRQFHAGIHAMSGSRIMADSSRRMWDLSDFLINTAGIPQPLSSATAARHDDHERIRLAIEAGDPVAARQQMERHIIGTVDVIHAERAEPADASD